MPSVCINLLFLFLGVVNLPTSLQSEKLGPVSAFHATPMGYNALYLTWKPPPDPNGTITGYKIYCREDLETSFGQKRFLEITDPHETAVMLTDLKPHTRYSIIIYPTTTEGIGKPNFLDSKTNTKEEQIPDQPSFNWTNLDLLGGKARVRVTWIPALEGHPGRGFYVQYKPKGECGWRRSTVEKEEHYIILVGLELGTVYEMKVVSVEGEHEKASEVQDVPTVPRAPDRVRYFYAKPLGYDALYLTWSPPDDPYRILTGFNIYYMKDLGDSFGLKRHLKIGDRRETRAKLTGLEPEIPYRLIIHTTTSKGDGVPYILEAKTNRKEERISVPDPPSFRWTNLDPLNYKARVRITWIPALDGHPGRNFYAQYKLKGECEWTNTTTEEEEVFVVLSGLKPRTVYEMRVASVEGQHETSSDVMYVPAIAREIESPFVPKVVKKATPNEKLIDNS